MRTILFVDDSTYTADTLKDFLQSHGYDVVFTSSGRIAIDLINDRKIQALLLDCHAPHAEEFAIAFRQARPNVPIVMISGYCGVPCDRLQYADACLQKGYSPAILLNTLATLRYSRRFGLYRSVPYRAA